MKPEPNGTDATTASEVTRSNHYKTKDLATITYLRGIAAFGVVLYHVRTDLWIGWKSTWLRTDIGPWDKIFSILSFPTAFMGSGVLLFFLISGFCIALPYVVTSPRVVNWRAYSVRRFFRIYPPYFAAIVLTLLTEICITIIGSGVVSSPLTYLASIGMVQNSTTGQIPTNGSLWTIPVEMQLYLAFPIAFYILSYLGSRAMLLFAAAVSIVGMLPNFSLIGQNFFTYWFVWCLGVLIAELYVLRKLRFSKLKLSILLPTLVLITIYGCISWMYGYFSTFGFGISFALFTCFALATESLWHPKVPTPVANALGILGTCSYSLYLIHYPFFKLVGAIWSNAMGDKPHSYLIPLFFAIVSVGLSWLFYMLIETPSHRFAKHLASELRKS